MPSGGQTTATTLELHRGEVCCVASTDETALQELARSACGHGCWQTRVHCDGKPVEAGRLRLLAAPAWVGETLFEDLSVAEHFFLHPGEGGIPLGVLQKKKIHEDATRLLSRFGAPLPLGSPVARLDANQRTLLALAAAALSPRPLLVLWRSARHLTLPQFETLTALLGEWKLAGRAILYFPDRVEELGLVADRLFVHQDGALNPVTGFRQLPPTELSALLAPRGGLNILSLYDPIHRARKLMLEQREAGSLNFESLAESVGLSYDFFRKEFRRKTGVSPKQYLLGLKLERAKELLLYSNESIEALAARLGFTDGSHFAKFFRARERQGPLEFRGSRGARFQH